MTETEKKEIAQRFITGLSNRDANLLKSIMTDDVVWSLPGKSVMSGEAHGVDAILTSPRGYCARCRRNRPVYELCKNASFSTDSS